MKPIRIYIAAAITVASLQFAEAAPVVSGPAETFLQIRRPPPPPDPLHLFSKRPRRKRAPRRPHISLPHIKLPPHPRHP